MVYDNMEHILLLDVNSTFRGEMPPLNYNEFE